MRNQLIRPLQIVMDTNVVVAALRSNRGASFRLLSLIGQSDRFEINLSTPVVLEYDEVLNRPGMVPDLTSQDIDDIVDYLCSVANLHSIFFLWRTIMKDPDDDMVLELAVEAQCDYIVTFNVRDFDGCERFGISAVRPQEFLRLIEPGE
jgi:putative PIN family toxin of toxin-antitoxin system